MPQVDVNTYMTTVFLISNCFILGYILFNIYIFLPVLNSQKVEKKLKILSNIRLLKLKTYLNLFNFFLLGLNLNKLEK
jgi:hypothetical protein